MSNQLSTKEFRWMVDFISKNHSKDLDKIKYKLGLSRADIVDCLNKPENEFLSEYYSKRVRNHFTIYYVFDYAKSNPGDLKFMEVFSNYQKDFESFPRFIEMIGNEFEANFLAEISDKYDHYLLPMKISEKIDQDHEKYGIK